MKSEKLEVVRGSGNVFRDLGRKSADAEQFKAVLAAEIIKALDREGLSVRAAHDRTGIAAADFSRIRNAEHGWRSISASGLRSPSGARRRRKTTGILPSYFSGVQMFIHAAARSNAAQ